MIQMDFPFTPNLQMVVIIKKGENVNVYHAGFDDAKVLPKDGCHHQKRGECE